MSSSVAHYTNGTGAHEAPASAAAPTPSMVAPTVRAEAALPHEKYRVEEVNRALVSLVGRPRTVLDVGCGVGLNGAAVKRTGAHVTGIEIVPRSIERARKVLDEVVSADITSDAAVAEVLGGRRFDLIMFADVLEHTTEPRAVLERFVPYLSRRRADPGLAPQRRRLAGAPRPARGPLRLPVERDPRRLAPPLLHARQRRADVRGRGARGALPGAEPDAGARRQGLDPEDPGRATTRPRPSSRSPSPTRRTRPSSARSRT